MAGSLWGQLEAGCGEDGYSPSTGASSSRVTQGEHFAGFFAGFGVDEEVLHEDFWGGGVRGAVLVVEVSFDVVLFADCFERLGDLDSGE